MDVDTLRDSRQLDHEAYVMAGHATAAGQMARGAYCGVDAVLRRADAGVEDDAGIRCAPAK